TSIATRVGSWLQNWRGRVELSLVLGPLFQDLVARVHWLVTPTSLVTILLTRLDVQGFAEELARLNVVEIDPLLQDPVVRKQLIHGEIAYLIRGIKFQRRHAVGLTVAGEA